MKTTLMQFVRSGIAAGVVLALSHFACGQAVETTTTTTTSSAGTVTTFDPSAIVIKSETSTEPVRYQYSKTTMYVDENGQPVAVETIKTGMPVTVYYERDGDSMVARKVIVRKAVTAEAAPAAVETATTMAGTVSSLDPQEIIVKSDGSTEPLRYHFTKTTTYVDENGQPVAVETVKSGMPVTVYYEKQGDDLIARRVVIRHAASGPVMEHKKTTTTTTEER